MRFYFFIFTVAFVLFICQPAGALDYALDHCRQLQASEKATGECIQWVQAARDLARKEPLPKKFLDGVLPLAGKSSTQGFSIISNDEQYFQPYQFRLNWKTGEYQIKKTDEEGNTRWSKCTSMEAAKKLGEILQNADICIWHGGGWDDQGTDLQCTAMLKVGYAILEGDKDKYAPALSLGGEDTTGIGGGCHPDVDLCSDQQSREFRNALEALAQNMPKDLQCVAADNDQTRKGK